MLIAFMEKSPLRAILYLSLIEAGLLLTLGFLVPPSEYPWVSDISPTSGAWAFSVGVFAAVVANRLRAPSLNASTWTAAEFSALTICLLANVMLYRYGPAPGRLVLGSFVGSMGAAPAYALLIVILHSSRGAFSAMLASRPLTYLGEVSFSFYLVHQVVIRKYADSPTIFSKLPPLLQLGIVAVISLVVAMAIFHLIETPSRKGLVRAWNAARRGIEIKRAA